MSMFDGQLGRLQKRNGQGALILILQLLKVDNDTRDDLDIIVTEPLNWLHHLWDHCSSGHWVSWKA